LHVARFAARDMHFCDFAQFFHVLAGRGDSDGRASAAPPSNDMRSRRHEGSATEVAALA
jgi:hypothetical protein